MRSTALPAELAPVVAVPPLGPWLLRLAQGCKAEKGNSFHVALTPD
jgi:hypothetical protein